MKKMLLVLLGVASLVVQGQSRFKYDKLFMESGIGLGIPLSHSAPQGESGGSLAPIHVQVGLRYMFDEQFGLLGTLNYDDFKNSSDERCQQKLMALELVYNVSEVLNLSHSINGNMGILLHGGLGVGAMTAVNQPNDYVGALIVGVRPMWGLNNKVAIFADLSTRTLLDQAMYYNGAKASYPNTDKFNSTQLAISFGFTVSLGQNRTNADDLY